MNDDCDHANCPGVLFTRGAQFKCECDCHLLLTDKVVCPFDGAYCDDCESAEKCEVEEQTNGDATRNA